MVNAVLRMRTVIIQEVSCGRVLLVVTLNIANAFNSLLSEQLSTTPTLSSIRRRRTRSYIPPPPGHGRGWTGHVLPSYMLQQLNARKQYSSVTYVAKIEHSPHSYSKFCLLQILIIIIMYVSPNTNVRTSLCEHKSTMVSHQLDKRHLCQLLRKFL